MDGLVRKIGRTYTSLGEVERVTTYDNSNDALNEIKYEYDANRRLKRLYQSHSGEVAPTTQYLEYTFDDANYGRLAGVQYPNGKQLSYIYDARNNITQIKDSVNPLVEYLYDGMGSTMQTTYLEPDVSLTYANVGLDRFGRVVNHSWMKDNDPLVHIIHGYDYAGNRTYRHDAVHAANSELYDYDQINQIKSLDRGVLNTNKDTVTVSNFTESWDFDKTGNWVQYDKNGSVENRTHNAANELQGIATHNANGNMTVIPSLKGKYDAWNRMVEVRDSSDNLIARYDYNGMNQRIPKTVGSTVTKSFFNEQWQELEAVTDSELTTYVWGLRYIDDFVLREKSEERLYSLADPNWNVVAIVDALGDVQERMKYDAFGKITWLEENFVAKTNSDFAWNRTFTGQVLDYETGVMLCRNRYYHTRMGRFVSRDPIGYSLDDMSLYRYVNNNPSLKFDPSGLEGKWPTWLPADTSVEEIERLLKNEKDPKKAAELRTAKKIKEQWVKRIRDKVKNSGRRGVARLEVLKCLAVVACEATCYALSKSCFNRSTDDYENCLNGAFRMKAELRERQIALCDRINVLDLTECSAKYLACALACLLPFNLPSG